MALKQSTLMFGVLTLHFAALQQLVFLNPVYALLFWVFIKTRKVFVIYAVIIVVIASIQGLVIDASTTGSTDFREYFQLFLDIILAGGVFQIIKTSSPSTLTKSISIVSSTLLYLAALSLIDYYIFNIGINQLLTSVTLWENSGDYIPRLSLTYSNPNWATFTVFFMIVVLVEYCREDKNFGIVLIKLLILTLFFQSKTGIALVSIYVALAVFGLSIRQIFYSLITIVSFTAILLWLSNAQSLGIGLVETASFLNRQAMYFLTFKEIKMFPVGLPGHQFYELLRQTAYEDTLPAFLKILYAFGWTLSVLLLYFVLRTAAINRRMVLFLTLVGFSLTYSFLDVSIIGSISVVLLCIVLDRREI